MPWRRLAIYVARKIAANPEARAQAADLARKAGLGAKRIVDDPSPARAAGRTVRRVSEQLRRKLRPDD